MTNKEADKVVREATLETPAVSKEEIQSMHAKQAQMAAFNMQQETMYQFFKYDHLPPFLQPSSKLFHDVAVNLILAFPRNPERTVALRKLLEAKDAAVRSMIFQWPNDPKDGIKPKQE